MIVPLSHRPGAHRAGKPRGVMSNLATLHNAFLDELSVRCSPLTVRQYRSNWTAYRGSLSAADVTAYLRTGQTMRHWGPRTVAAKIAHLRAFGKWLTTRYPTIRCDVETLASPPIPRTVPTSPSHSTIDAILAGDASMRDRAVIGLLYYCGLRRAEACMLPLAACVA